jgi:glucose-6-phosphate dehydrogenase assembly protein OpcA
MSTAAEAPSWTGTIESLSEVTNRLHWMREECSRSGEPDLRTSVLTHIAWVPPEWERAATDVLAGLADRHPSRVILLVPEPDSDDHEIEATLTLNFFSLADTAGRVASELIELRLRGERTRAPASIVVPLLLSNLPVFLRWRGRPDFEDGAFTGFLDVVDRLVVDSTEWPDVPDAYGELMGVFERTAVSDIAWSRGGRWRGLLSEQWPEIAEVRTLRIKGPWAVARLLGGWLSARLDRRFELEHEEAPLMESIELDGRLLDPPRGDRPTPSDLLSEELEQFGRDRVYEQAVAATL